MLPNRTSRLRARLGSVVTDIVSSWLLGVVLVLCASCSKRLDATPTEQAPAEVPTTEPQAHPVDLPNPVDALNPVDAPNPVDAANPVPAPYSPLFEQGRHFRYRALERRSDFYYSEKLQRQREEVSVLDQHVSCHVARSGRSTTMAWSEVECVLEAPKREKQSSEAPAPDEVVAGGVPDVGPRPIEGLYVLEGEHLRRYAGEGLPPERPPSPAAIRGFLVSEYPRRLEFAARSDEDSELRVEETAAGGWCVTAGSYGCFDVSDETCFQAGIGIRSVEALRVGNPGSVEVEYQLQSP